MLYTEAAPFLSGAKPGSLKSTVYRAYEKKSGDRKADPRQVVSLLSNTLRHRTVLTQVIKQAKLLEQERLLNKDTALVMVHDLLLSKSGRINCGKNPLKDAVLRHKTRLKAELVKYKIKHKITTQQQLADKDQNEDETPVRWVRINRVKVADNVDKVEEQLLAKRTKVDKFTEITPGSIYKDVHVKHLYGIHPTDQITVTQLYKSGQIIIQDRASCFPAEILDPAPGDVLIDACSAPGNKTTHLAAHVTNSDSVITAFERDTKRAETLKKMVRLAGADCVQIKVQDFTACDPQDHANVTGILVDPSCSGSGIFGRGFDEESNQQSDKFRLHNLAEFQYKIMMHALSFPNVRKVVYSTCSIHEEENEQVVKRLLEDAHGWQLAPNALPQWPRRGVTGALDHTLSQHCVRAIPKQDGGIGFFAACFERKS